MLYSTSMEKSGLAVSHEQPKALTYDKITCIVITGESQGIQRRHVGNCRPTRGRGGKHVGLSRVQANITENIETFGETATGEAFSSNEVQHLRRLLNKLDSFNVATSNYMQIMHDHPDSWPFKEPVDARDVPDYYDIIKDPIDLKTMSKRVESELYYVTFDMFVADVRRMFANARTYNSPETIYYKCATRLESHFSNKVQAGLQSGIKIQ